MLHCSSRQALGFDIFNIHDFYYGIKNFQGNVMDKAYSKNLAVSQNPIVSDYFLEPGDYLKALFCKSWLYLRYEEEVS